VTDHVAAAIAAARELGLPVDDAEVVAGAANVFVHLRPAPVVARVTVTLDRGPEALAAELAFARLAADRGAPVVPPADERVHGKVTFWQYVEHRRPEPADAPAIGRALRELHEAVADLDLPLVRFDRLDEVEAIASTELMHDAIAFARKRLAQLELTEQPIHGDAHMRNALMTAQGPLWADFENVCRGPVEYDLACAKWRTVVHGWDGGATVLDGYGAHDEELVDQLMPILAAFLVPWNARMANADDPFLEQRIDYLRTFV
jgi:Ser/Thr protein kinase RdoA (MazF antagonist)